MGAPQTVADVLDAAADLIEPEGAWTQGATARDAEGVWTRANAASAVCFCAGGAIVKAGHGGYHQEKALDCLRSITDEYVTRWNDKPGRTQSEVIAKLREAAQLARAREGTPT